MLNHNIAIPHLEYLPASFSAEEIQSIQMLAGMAVQHVLHDPETTISPQLVHEVAKTLIEAECDARTVMIFFMSLLDAEARAELARQYPRDLLEAAQYASIIRLLSEKDNPKHPAIRKVLLRQLVLKVTHDVRVMMIKIAGRVVTLRHAEHWQPKLREKLAQEALDVVVPWCDALGIENWRQELQELSFKYLMPEQYNQILSIMADQRGSLETIKDQVVTEITDLLKRHHLDARVTGRVKTHYAVFRKMKAYDLSYDEVWDRIGIRILTHSGFECYYAQMAIEEELYPDRRRFVDYIEKPRAPYHYQSLHLTVCGPQDTMVEIQIRTFDMHIKGEYGVAAHWKMYGGGEGVLSNEDKKFAFLRTQASRLLGDPVTYLGNTLDELLFNNSILPYDTSGYVLDPDTGERVKSSRGEEIHYRQAATNDKGYVIDPHTEKPILSASGDLIWFQGEILPDRIIVYTPNGDLMSLPKNATPLDFAYYIHEEVGHSCVGAKVNGRLVKLDYTLQLGDRIEVQTRQGTKPSMDWLYNGFARTRRAHEKIKRFFREKSEISLPEISDHDLGKSIIRKRLSAHRIRDLAIEKLAEMMHYRSADALQDAVGSGEVEVAQLDEVLGNYMLRQLSEQPPATPDNAPTQQEFDLLYKQAQCCLPLPGDKTIRYISQGKGFTLHQVDCRNISSLDPERIMEFDWVTEGGFSPEKGMRFISRLVCLVVNPSRTVLFIKEVASIEGVPIEGIRINEARGMGYFLEITLRVSDKAQLEKIQRKLNTSDDVLMVRRAEG